jgi:hypothetical protein
MQNPAVPSDVVAELLARLQAYALADPNASPTMSDGQIDVALELLGKVLPDQIEIAVVGHERAAVGTKFVDG